MCRGFQQNDRHRFNIKAFYIHLSVCTAHISTIPDDSLTLYFLPRINGSPLEINDSKIPPNSPAFVTLHRFVSAGTLKKGAIIFGSRDRVRASSEGVRFEVYLREERVLKGIFRKEKTIEGADHHEWKMECKCGLENQILGVELTEMEVCVAVEGPASGKKTMNEMVKMVQVKKKKKKKRCFKGYLEEIPEERELDDYSSCELELEGDQCCCGCGDEEYKEKLASDWEEVVDLEGVRWAVDVGIWVMCLGVGYLVSKASSKSLRSRRLL